MLGDILGQNQFCLLLTKLKFMGCDFDVDQSAIFFSMSPNACDRWSGPICFNVRQQSRNIFLRADVFEGHFQKLFSGIAIMANSRLVDSEETQSRGVVYPHRERIELKQKLKVT